jgi:hypothetical protein
MGHAAAPALELLLYPSKPLTLNLLQLHITAGLTALPAAILYPQHVSYCMAA